MLPIRLTQYNQSINQSYLYVMKIIQSFRQLSFSVGCNVEQNVHHLHVINMYLSRNLAVLSNTGVLRGRNIRNFPYSTYRQIPMLIRQSRNIHKIEYNVILYLSANQAVFLAHPSGGERNMRDQTLPYSSFLPIYRIFLCTYVSRGKIQERMQC